MAKAQGKKKAATAARRATSRAASRVKSAARAVTKKVKAAPAKPARKVAKVVKAVAKAARPAAKKPPKPAKRPAAAAPPAKRGPALTVKPVAVHPPAAKAPVAPKVPAAPQPDAKKTRTRRARPRVHSNGTPVAAWLPQDREKPRPSSFIPAPPRAEAPSLIAAPPASSDRLIRPEDVTEFVTRTVPIRVDIEQGGGRFYIGVNPEEVTLRAGEGIEWDFRYLGGADVTADEVVIEFEKPSPFSHTMFKSRKPGAARPHRQLSGAAHKTAVGKRVQYTIRAMTPFKTELAAAKLWVHVAG
jgi:hypothetical protein